MPTPRHGKNTRVFVDDIDFSPSLREYSTTGQADPAETSAFGTSDKTYVIGLIGGDITFSGMFSGANNEVDERFNAWNGDDLDHVVSIYHEGTVAGGRVTTVNGKFHSKSISGSISDIVGIQAAVIGDGPMRSGASVHDFTVAETTGGNTTGIDNTAASALGGSGTLHVTANSRNGATVAKIQHSTDNSIWSDLITFTSVPNATTAKEKIALGATATVNRYVRGLWTIAGSSGSVSFALSFTRHTF